MSPGQPSQQELVERCVRLALACIRREFPNQPQHVLRSHGELALPRQLHPIFYGCFDWHSAVHSHWLLVRALKASPDAALDAAVREALSSSFTPDKAAAEADYLSGEDRGTFERPYGLAWLLQLMAELRSWEHPLGREWADALAPLETAAAENLKRWLESLLYPVRSGTHSQTAFAFGLYLDWACVSGNDAMHQRVVEKALDFYGDESDAPIAYEPSGEDFLSPTLMTADLMTRLLDPSEFSDWLTRYLPGLPVDGAPEWLPVARVTDETDGRLVHLHGLNLSRAWNLVRLADALPPSDPRVAGLRRTAALHEATGLEALSSDHYATSHWVATFAVYLMTVCEGTTR